MNLNPVHAELLADILKFTKYQHSQRLKSIEHCFKTSLTRLREDEVYTGDEVGSIIHALQDTISSEVDSEFKDLSHTNGLMVQQLLVNAEQWHLTLRLDISDLENREKLDMIKNFDEGKCEPTEDKRMSITVTQTNQIIPIEDHNVTISQKIRIDQLEEEKGMLEVRLEETKTQLNILSVQISEERDKRDAEMEKLKENLEVAQTEIERLLHMMADEEPGGRHLELESVQKDIRRMSLELEQSRNLAEAEATKLRQDLEMREDKLRQVQSSLLLAEKELDKKFQATAAYGNMKKILVQKNRIVKSLRQKLIDAGVKADDDSSEIPIEED